MTALLAVLWACAAVAAAEPAPPPAVGPSPDAAGTTVPAAPPARSAARAHASVGVTDFRYRELDGGGAVIDREEGLIPGVRLGGSWRSGAWEVGGELGWFASDVDYAGRTQTGEPITTETGEEMTSAALRVWRWLELGGASVAPYAGLGYHRWERDIRPTRTAAGDPVAGLFETYRWWTAELGVHVLAVSWRRLRAGIDARLVRTLGPAVEVDFDNGWDDPTLELGDDVGHRLALHASHALTPSTDLHVELHTEAWELGRSREEPVTLAGAPTGVTVHEPRSETRNVGVSVGVRARF